MSDPEDAKVALGVILLCGLALAGVIIGVHALDWLINALGALMKSGLDWLFKDILELFA